MLPLISRCYSCQHSRSHISNIVGNPQDFFSYIGGRWVWDEKQQLQENIVSTIFSSCRKSLWNQQLLVPVLEWES
ncbi:hypothetical protein BDW60DRAFT_20645 [Aspergillus nidulans var. acristatus]